MARSFSFDQTKPSWVSQSSPNQVGTGLFLIHVIPPTDPDALWREDFQDVTYNYCRRRSEHPAVKALKWVPHLGRRLCDSSRPKVRWPLHSGSGMRQTRMHLQHRETNMRATHITRFLIISGIVYVVPVGIVVILSFRWTFGRNESTDEAIKRTAVWVSLLTAALAAV